MMLEDDDMPLLQVFVQIAKNAGGPLGAACIASSTACDGAKAMRGSKQRPLLAEATNSLIYVLLCDYIRRQRPSFSRSCTIRNLFKAFDCCANQRWGKRSFFDDEIAFWRNPEGRWPALDGRRMAICAAGKEPTA